MPRTKNEISSFAKCLEKSLNDLARLNDDLIELGNLGNKLFVISEEQITPLIPKASESSPENNIAFHSVPKKKKSKSSTISIDPNAPDPDTHPTDIHSIGETEPDHP